VRVTIRANAKFVVGALPKYISYEEKVSEHDAFLELITYMYWTLFVGN
jgi:hypothetical protein